MQKKLTALFERNLVINAKNKEYLNKLSLVLNLTKLDFWTRRKTLHYYNINFEDEYLAYRFSILKKWIELNQNYDQTFVTNVYEIIAILCLENELTTQELNYINEFRSVTFAKNRNIKNLIVDFKLLPKEEIWYTYEIIGLVELENDVQNIISKNTQVYLSSQRMIIAKQGNITLSLDYNQIKTLKPSLNKLKIETIKKTYFIIASEITTLYVSFERVGRLIRKKL